MTIPDRVMCIHDEIEVAEKIRFANDRTVDDVADRVMDRHAVLMRKLAH